MQKTAPLGLGGALPIRRLTGLHSVACSVTEPNAIRDDLGLKSLSARPPPGMRSSPSPWETQRRWAGRPTGRPTSPRQHRPSVRLDPATTRRPPTSGPLRRQPRSRRSASTPSDSEFPGLRRIHLLTWARQRNKPTHGAAIYRDIIPHNRCAAKEISSI